MNPYLKNLNRIEFMITHACTGRCKHCSEGDHMGKGGVIDGSAAAEMIAGLCRVFQIGSLMTFGGEPLLYPDEVCRIHAMARDMRIPKRQMITNGFFSQDEDRIRDVARNLAAGGVNDILLSVDAFHQETIPLGPVKVFAGAVQDAGIPLRAHPAWLVRKEDNNPYNERTREILKEFADMGISVSGGNVIFPGGNAIKYLKEYFEPGAEIGNPYEENPRDVRAVCVSPDGTVLGGNICRTGIMELIENYDPDIL